MATTKDSPLSRKRIDLFAVLIEKAEKVFFNSQRFAKTKEYFQVRT
jgi:hypothetical protein